MNLYAERNERELGEHYTKHVSAMTGEDLHSKAAIAAELAYRDARIEKLEKALIDFKERYSLSPWIINQVDEAIGEKL